jgi:hypothetical protein
MPFACSGEIVPCQIGENSVGLGECGDMFDDGGWHLTDRHEVSQALEGLQKNQKAQISLLPTGDLLSKFVRGKGKARDEIEGRCLVNSGWKKPPRMDMGISFPFPTPPMRN